MSARSRRIRFWGTLVVVLVAIGGASAEVYRIRQAQSAVTLPVAPARQGDFLVIIRCRGDLKARRSAPIYTPMVPNLRIAWLSPPGQKVEAGETIVKFDSSSAEQQLQQKEAQLKQAQATLDQALAQAKITAEQDNSDLQDAKFTVERARLEASKQAIVSRIQGEESKIDLGMAEQKLKVQEATVALHAASDRSKIASLTRLRDQAAGDVDLTKSRIAQMVIKAPLTGYLVFASNYSQGWINAKPFKVGDNVFGGMGLAEMPDLDTLQMDGKVEEIDRGRIEVNDEVRVRVDSLPELTISAKIGQISLLAETTYEWPPTRNFRAYAPIPHPDPRLRPGMNGGMDIIIKRIPNAISIPAKALYTRAGKPIVYLANNGHYRAREVQVQARNPDEVAITGVPAGSMVALVDAEKQDQKK
ncbi:MAG: efflux RND transporter periplasmic adaptor subunit [Acidobacteriia bacterium]|nr:efflux RND transporter periplasmic adaptor subunit [Terriglobia bacterium]